MLSPGLVDDYDFILIARQGLLIASPDTLDKAFTKLFRTAGLINPNE